MTHDDIISMAREAGVAGLHPSMGVREADLIAIVRFAELVAAAERERCAARQDERAKKYSKEGMIVHIIEMCADDIRAMGSGVQS